MNCYFCEKHLADGNTKGFVCICDMCLESMEKAEARMVQKICDQDKELRYINKSKESK